MSEDHSDIWKRINETHDEAMRALNNITSHEAICIANQNMIMARLNEIESTVRWTTRVLLAGMAALLVGIIFSGLHQP